MSIFVHVGFPKSASTFLQECLFQNNNYNFNLYNRKAIADLIGKPGAFDFNLSDTKEKLQNFKKYSIDQNKIPIISQEFLVGNEYLNGGVDAPIYLQRLYECIPESKIIIIIREQCSFLYSFYKHDISYNNGFHSLKKFLSNEWHFNRSSKFILRYLKYDKLISNYIKSFGKKNVLILPYELLKENKKQFINNIFDFTSCQYNHLLPLNVNPINSSRSIRLVILQKYINKILTSQNERSFRISKNITTFLNRRFFTKLDKLIFSKFDNRSIDLKNMREIQKIIGNYYLESNKNLQKIVDFDLSKFHYNI